MGLAHRPRALSIGHRLDEVDGRRRRRVGGCGGWACEKKKKVRGANRRDGGGHDASHSGRPARQAAGEELSRRLRAAGVARTAAGLASEGASIVVVTVA
jgi:hypothetical protein